MSLYCAVQSELARIRGVTTVCLVYKGRKPSLNPNKRGIHTGPEVSNRSTVEMCDMQFHCSIWAESQFVSGGSGCVLMQNRSKNATRNSHEAWCSDGGKRLKPKLGFPTRVSKTMETGNSESTTPSNSAWCVLTMNGSLSPLQAESTGCKNSQKKHHLMWLLDKNQTREQKQRVVLKKVPSPSFWKDFFLNPPRNPHSVVLGWSHPVLVR